MHFALCSYKTHFYVCLSHNPWMLLEIRLSRQICHSSSTVPNCKESLRVLVEGTLGTLLVSIDMFEVYTGSLTFSCKGVFHNRTPICSC